MTSSRSAGPVSWNAEIWLRLAKIAEAGAVLGADSKRRLKGLSAQYPEWQLAADQRDEFPYWIEGWVATRDPWRSFKPRRVVGVN